MTKIKVSIITKGTLTNKQISVIDALFFNLVWYGKVFKPLPFVSAFFDKSTW